MSRGLGDVYKRQVLRNSPGAGEHLGVEIASLARLAVAEVPDLPVAVRVDTVAEFADLLRRAAANEEAELTIAASARRAAMRESAMLFGLSAAATLVLTRSAGPAARLLLERGISDGVTLATRPRPAPGVDAPDYGKATHDVMVTAAARRLTGDAALRERYAPDADPAAWHGVKAVLAQLERSADGDPAEVDRLVYDVEARVRTLGAGRYLDELLQRPAVHRLTKSAADPD